MAVPQFRIASWSTALALLVGAWAAVGCSTGARRLETLDAREPLAITVDCNTRVFPMIAPGRAVRLDGRPVAPRRIKFWVDLVNNSDQTIDLSDLEIELLATQRESQGSARVAGAQPAEGGGMAQEEEERIHLRQTWSYRWKKAIRLLPGRKLSVPIVPEPQEFPLHHLSPGRYLISAVVNRKFESKAPYRLKIHRPEIQRLRPA